MNIIRILLVDDQNLMLQGIKVLLEDEPKFQVVGFANNGRSAVEEAERLQPDIVLIDLEMPKMNGITATEYISCLVPQTKVIVLTSHDREQYIIKAIQAGAKGYLLKSSLAEDLKQAIWAVSKGYSQIEFKLLTKVVNLKKARKPQESQTVQAVLAKPQSAIESEIIQQQSLFVITKSLPRHKTGILNSFYKYCFTFFKNNPFKQKRSHSVVNTTSLNPIFEALDEATIRTSKQKTSAEFITKSSLNPLQVSLTIRWIQNSWLGKFILLIIAAIITAILF